MTFLLLQIPDQVGDDAFLVKDDTFPVGDDASLVGDEVIAGSTGNPKTGQS